MSIVDSRVERDAARATLEAASVETLERDLVWWTITSHEHAEEASRLHDLEAAQREQWHEAASWAALISDELLRRRREGRG